VGIEFITWRAEINAQVFCHAERLGLSRDCFRIPRSKRGMGREQHLAGHRGRLNAAATLGKYTTEMEAASESEDDAPHRHDWHDD